VSPETTGAPGGRPRMKMWVRVVAWVGAVLGVAILAAAIVGVAFTLQATFFTRFHSIATRKSTLQASAHRDIPCIACHAGKAGTFGFEAAAVGDFYGSLITTPAVLRFVTFAPPTSDACLECHRYDWSRESSRTAKVPHPAHLRVYSETRECVTCHRWTSHEEAYQTFHTSMPFSVVCASFECHVGTKARSDCVNCHHVLQEGQGGWRLNHPKTVAAAGPNGCLENCHKADQCRECHTTGKATSLPSSTATASVTAVEVLHVKADWVPTAHGPVALKDPNVCKTCHISEGECQDCHSQRPAFHGPQSTWLKNHQTLGTTPNLPRCLTCHQQAWCDACHAQFKQK
jgi:hypothetical protein